MNKIIVSTLVAAGLALSASSAFAHGRLVTGPELYATPETSQATAPASQDENSARPHKTRVIHHAVHSLRSNTAS